MQAVLWLSGDTGRVGQPLPGTYFRHCDEAEEDSLSVVPHRSRTGEGLLRMIRRLFAHVWLYRLRYIWGFNVVWILGGWLAL